MDRLGLVSLIDTVSVRGPNYFKCIPGLQIIAPLPLEKPPNNETVVMVEQGVRGWDMRKYIATPSLVRRKLGVLRPGFVRMRGQW